ncbi:Hypothetical protein CINCED_3A016238 [Cinara cedri]|uniref:Major facilitator superfamily (MFS) profile domain-containing protein n=1 Tax=Cinara cedri TaxID=506608 RepID=A0A5E4N3N8_9HEMI|nr:Hypothetical protein CINCED_3A016238 [Cinara cedri]
MIEYNNKDIEKNEQNPVDFETAIKHTGYGWYNQKMLACFLPISLTTIMCTASPSFIVPATRCYFQLTPLKEGMMFGAFYVGMMLSSFLWGFLIDTLGRQKLFFYGLLFTAILEFCSGLAQQFWSFIFLKILCGFISCCPNSLGFTFLSEFYDKQHRDTIVLCAGGFAAISFVVQPILAYVLIPLDIDFEFFYGFIAISNWRIFIIAGSGIMFLSTYLTYFMDESPKFLMAVGRHKEALHVFRKMYSQNTGNPPQSYPLTSLASEVMSEDRCIKSMPSELFAWDFVKEGWSQIKPLFMKPYLTLTILGSILQFMTMLMFTTFRFKLPKMYATILAAEGLLMSNAETNVISDCSENVSVLVNPDVYVKNIYIGAGSLILFWLAVYSSQYVDKHYMFRKCTYM